MLHQVFPLGNVKNYTEIRVAFMFVTEIINHSQFKKYRNEKDHRLVS